MNSTDQTQAEGHGGAAPERRGSVGSKLRGLLLAIVLFPALAAFILDAQGDFDPFGTWIKMLVESVTAVGVLVVWGVTGKSQR